MSLGTVDSIIRPGLAGVPLSGGMSASGVLVPDPGRCRGNAASVRPELPAA